MIIARATTANPPGEFLLLGLSRENVNRLIAGQPIVLRRASHGGGVPEGWTIAITFGETELEIQRTLSQAGWTRA